jgi:hypothetical protein
VFLKNSNSYALFHAQGVLNFFLAPGRDLIYSYIGKDDTEPKSFIRELNLNGWAGMKNYFSSPSLLLFLVNVLVTPWNILLLLGLLAFTFSKRVPFEIKIIAIFIILYIAGVSSLAAGTARYKVAIYPILLFANGYFLSRQWSVVSNTKLSIY